MPVQAHVRAARSSQGDMLRDSTVAAQEHRRNPMHIVEEGDGMQVLQALPASGPGCTNYETTMQPLCRSLWLLRVHVMEHFCASKCKSVPLQQVAAACCALQSIGTYDNTNCLSMARCCRHACLHLVHLMGGYTSGLIADSLHCDVL